MTTEAPPAWSTLTEWLAVSDDILGLEAGAVEQALGSERLAGCCDLCGRDGGFHNTPATISLREGLACAHCRCNARQRAAATVLLDALGQPARARVYVTEHSSAFYLALRRRVGRLVGSEFGVGTRQRLRLSLWLLKHGAWPWLRLQDVTALRMADASLDGIVSLDVLEHVPDTMAALREFVRVLKPDGVLVLTVPFYDRQADNVQIARPDGHGGIEHFGEPEFHGDPRGGGVACFHHFGWELLGSMRAVGFRDAVACRVQDAAAGLPQGQWVLRARR